MLEECLELCASEGRVLSVLVQSKVLQLLFDGGDAGLTREGREERSNHVVGHVGRDVAEG